ncbi:hypothetical protein BS78_05G242300 [Paspalum vaginatum]|nr:hypothetical protein BS78_05G242300 [Paspalum vaginatum]
MHGDRRLLKDFQLRTPPGSVALPNGAALRVLGTGCLQWGSFSVPDVSLVEDFQQSLISVSQLDRQHGMHVCFGSGKVMLHDGTVVGGAILDDRDGMYSSTSHDHRPAGRLTIISHKARLLPCTYSYFFFLRGYYILVLIL